MTYREAAIQLLREAGEPVHYRDLAVRALERGMIEPKGQTPEATMASQLYVLARRVAEGGEGPPVRSVGKGYFQIGPEVRATRLDDEIRANNEQVKRELLDHLRAVDPRQLEHLVGQLLEELGYEDVEVTQYVGDEGIDVVATLTAGGVASVSTAVQVKRHTTNVGRPAVQQLRGSLAADQRGLIITTGGFSKGAREEATAAGRLPIALVDGERFASLLIEHDIGVTRKPATVLELDLDSIATPVEETDGGRSAALWPLPGGQDRYFTSLLEFLDRIGDEGVELAELTAWVIDTYERVTKEQVVASYLRTVLASLGLVQFDGELVSLSEAGRKLRAERSADALLAVLRDQILGVDELLEILREGPKGLDELNDELCAAIGRTWDTPTQTRHRLVWLMNAGGVERDGDTWRIKPDFSADSAASDADASSQAPAV